MPCDTIQTTGVELTNPHMASLMEALRALMLNPHLEQSADGTQTIRFNGGTFSKGKLTMRSRSGLTAQDVRARYAQEIGSFAARQFGFKMQETTARTKGAIAAFKLVRNR